VVRIPNSEEHHAAAETLFRKVAREHEEGRVKRGREELLEVPRTSCLARPALCRSRARSRNELLQPSRYRIRWIFRSLKSCLRVIRQTPMTLLT
jgi:hypothetical protein